MNQILAKRYAFCNFSSISGYPNLVPTRDEWERSIPRFRGEEWEVPAEHLLDFHDFIDRLEILHEDVQIKLFKFSLEGIALDWCQSLPSASVSSLADFHAAFHVFCEDHFPADLLYPQCCHEFHLLTKDSDVHEEYDVIGDISHCDQYIDELHNVSHSIDAFDIVTNASIALGYQEDPISPFENLKNDDQIDKLESETVETAIDDEGSLQFQDLQELKVCSRYRESDGEEEHKGSDQKLTLYFPSTKITQSTFSIEFCEGKEQQQHSQLNQQFKEVFFYDFEDPIADFFYSISSIDVKIFMSEEDYLHHPLKPLFCMIWPSLLFGSRSSMMPTNQFLTWLHWKYTFT
jgi:hypothetical protein